MPFVAPIPRLLPTEDDALSHAAAVVTSSAMVT